jgi:hypothetical protein
VPSVHTLAAPLLAASAAAVAAVVAAAGGRWWAWQWSGGSTGPGPASAEPTGLPWPPTPLGRWTEEWGSGGPSQATAPAAAASQTLQTLGSTSFTALTLVPASLSTAYIHSIKTTFWGNTNFSEAAKVQIFTHTTAYSILTPTVGR